MAPMTPVLVRYVRLATCVLIQPNGLVAIGADGNAVVKTYNAGDSGYVNPDQLDALVNNGTVQRLPQPSAPTT